MWFFTKKQTFKARENAGDQVVIGFSFASDWFSRRVARVFWTNIEQIKAKSKEILDYFRHSIENGFDIQILQTYVYKSLCGRR